ncbi:MAG: helix-turn-helix domain-containing protein [Marinilabiliaceae bacterium]|nr:helix-turn-helix domain-containing protein [Marinilabiliaceae bacterium]
MKDQFLSEQISGVIPSMQLMHGDLPVAFAYRTAGYIWDKTGGQPDVPHRHNFYTIIWIHQGRGKHYLDYREHDLAPDVIFFVSPGQVHQMVTDERPEGEVIMFTREFLDRHHIREDFIFNLGLFAHYADVPPLHVDAEGAVRLRYQTRQIAESFDSGRSYAEDALAAYLKLFLIECNRVMEPQAQANPQSLQAGRQLVGRFKQLLEQRFNAWHKVSDYADALGITPDYLNNVMKLSIGRNAKEYIQERIVLEARRLGVHTQLTSKEIAYDLGFDDPAHFSKFYKNVSGQSFSDFRARLMV